MPTVGDSSGSRGVRFSTMRHRTVRRWPPRKRSDREYHMNVASATRVPWVDANGWRFEREPGRSFFYDAPPDSAALAAAEAFAYGVEAAIRAAPEDLAPFARMLKFLSEIDQPH